MTIDDVKGAGWAAVNRVLRLRRSVLAAGLVAVLAAALIGIVELVTPGQYGVLFDGLSPAQGGAVIAHLQKLGIPYKLSDDGNIIQVPRRDLGEARLRLGKAGEPAGKGGKAWRSLEKAPMTASSASVQALHLQATESSLEHAVKQMSGATNVRVLLAQPRHTPFLANQPKPKASVVLEGAPQADGALGRAVSALVSSAVPGLSRKSVVVETKGGRILYPRSHVDSVMQQMAIKQRIEQTKEAKLRSLLNPLFGPGNYRIAVAADVDFSRKTIKSISYGPKSLPTSTDKTEKSRIGSRPMAMGIPGALSNQPPGATAAPVKTGSKGAAAKGKKAGGKGAQSSAASAKKSLPRSTSKHVTRSFAVDQKDVVDRPAGWLVKSVAVSIVVNNKQAGTPSAVSLKHMVAGAIDVPKSRIQVTSASFLGSGASSTSLFNQRLVAGAKAALVLFAALFLLVGGVLPFLRWVRAVDRNRLASAGAEAVAGGPAQPPPPIGLPDDGIQKPLVNLVGRIGEIADSDPATVAKMLQKWTREAPQKQAKS